MSRNSHLGCMVVVLAGCALPENTAVRDWARSASLVADYPLMMSVDTSGPGSMTARGGPARGDGVRATQEALAIYLYAVGVLAEEGVLTFREDSYAPLAARAMALGPLVAAAVSSIGALLSAARSDNPRPGERAYTAGQDEVHEDQRLRHTIRQADASVQILVAALSDAVATPSAVAPEASRAAVDRPGGGSVAGQSAREAQALSERVRDVLEAGRAEYVRILAQIGQGHALLKARARHITQEETARLLRTETIMLRHAMTMRPRDAAAPGGGSPYGVIGATVQP